MKKLLVIMAVLVAIFTSSCSKKKSFTVRADYEGLGSQTLYATYLSDGKLIREAIEADGGEVRFRGSSKTPTLVLLSMSDGSSLLSFVAQNGDAIKIRGNLHDPYQVELSGSGPSKKMIAWRAENSRALYSGDAREINMKIKEFVERHKGDVASSALLVSYFRTQGYEALADSLLSIIDPEARPTTIVQDFPIALASQIFTESNSRVLPMSLYERCDSMVFYSPERYRVSMLAFLPSTKPARDSIVLKLRALQHRMAENRLFRLVEISTAPDSAAWRQSVEGDSAGWSQTWAPATTASMALRRLAIPQMPYFVVADSTGAQIYRGPSVRAGIDVINKFLKQ